MPKKITMQHIANYVGVSKFAVSKALSGKSGVSAETREKIFKAATQLGYFIKTGDSPEGPAANPIDLTKNTARKEFVAVLLPTIPTRYQSKDSAYWGRILDGISQSLQKHGLGMITISDVDENISAIINPQGLLGIIGVGLIATPVLLEVSKLGVPFLLVDHEDPLIPSDTLFMNNFEATRRLTNYLIGLGHRSLQFVGGISYARSFYDRWLGFRSALEENKVQHDQIAELIDLQRYNKEDFYHEIKSCLSGKKAQQLKPTAFVCANDNIALTVIAALKELGRHVPNDSAVTGFDNIDEAENSSPALTTVNSAKEQMGGRAVELLLSRLERKGGMYEKTLMWGDIILRETT